MNIIHDNAHERRQDIEQLSFSKMTNFTKNDKLYEYTEKRAYIAETLESGSWRQIGTMVNLGTWPDLAKIVPVLLQAAIASNKQKEIR